ncbi:MAG: hypothetical protein IJ562_00325 [Prevotella sp.]|nr:hypothetical protein [Prevotella sp.]
MPRLLPPPPKTITIDCKADYATLKPTWAYPKHRSSCCAPTAPLWKGTTTYRKGGFSYSYGEFQDPLTIAWTGTAGHNSAHTDR